MYEKFNEFEMNILAEVGNMSVGGAAGSLGDFIHKTVNISIPKVKIMNKEEIFEKFGKDCIIVRINFVEGVKLSNLMVLEKEEAYKFAELVLKNKISNFNEEEMDEMAEEVLKEVFNIMVGNMTANMGEILSKHVKIDTPKFITKEEHFEIDKGSYIATWFELRIENDMKMKLVDIVDEEQARFMIDTIKEGQNYERYE